MLKHWVLGIICLFSFSAVQAQKLDDHRVIVIMTDGFRWQEVFGGMDSSIVKVKRFHHGDSASIVAKYWSPEV
ncbi:MAG: hypothetical protein RIS42_638, partial [Bacteroidota bacterium]